MTSCVLMHIMINENEHGQYLDYSLYDLMGNRCSRGDGTIEFPAFLEVCHEVQESYRHDNIQKDLIQEWWS